jgi:hypothetical protein
MDCNTPSTPVPPAPSISVESTITDEKILHAVSEAGAALQHAGVSKVKVASWASDDSINITPVGGNRAEVNKALDALKTDIEKAGYDAYEAPIWRCGNSPMELRVYRREGR